MTDSSIRVPLGRILVNLPITDNQIRVARCRAKKAGRLDPYPWVVRVDGFKPTYAVVAHYNEAAVQMGWPTFPFAKNGMR